MSKNIGVLVQLHPEVIAMIDQQVSGPIATTGAPGVYGSGRSGWIRDLIYNKLELSDPREVAKLTAIPVHKINMEILNDMERLIVTLARQFTVPYVLRYLDQQKVKPAQGKRWHTHQVHAILNSAAAKSYTWLVGQLEPDEVEESGE